MAIFFLLFSEREGTKKFFFKSIWCPIKGMLSSNGFPLKEVKGGDKLSVMAVAKINPFFIPIAHGVL